MMKADVTVENKPACSPTNVRFGRRPGRMRKNTHNYQHVIHIFGVFIDKVAVTIVGRPMELLVEFNGGVGGRLRKESCQCFKYGILQAENDGKRRG